VTNPKEPRRQFGLYIALAISLFIGVTLALAFEDQMTFAQTTDGRRGTRDRDDDERLGWPQVTIDFDVPEGFHERAQRTGGIPVKVVVVDRLGQRQAIAPGMAPGAIVETVSPSAIGLRVRVENADAEVALPAEFRAARVRVVIVPDGYGWSDLAWALGGTRRVRVAKLTAEITDVRPAALPPFHRLRGIPAS
jgi:hypothetical protein